MSILFLAMLAMGQAPEVEAVKVYLGADGQSVEVVTLKPRADGKALLRVRGADSEHDGLVLPCQVRQGGRGTDYVTRYRGADWVVLVQREGVYQVFLPERPEFQVKFNQDATTKATPGELVTALSAQKAEGRLQAFQKKAWPTLVAKYEGLAKAAALRLSKACGRPIEVGFDWKSFDDGVMGEVDVWKACAPIVARLESSCAIAKQAKAVTCRMGAAFALAIEAEALVFTTTPTGQNGAQAFLAAQK